MKQIEDRKRKKKEDSAIPNGSILSILSWRN